MWSMILSWLPSIIGFALKKMGDNAEVKQKFLDFVDAVEKHQLASVRLNESDRAQMDDLEKQRERLQNENS